MSKLKMYSIRDAKVEAFARPFFLQAHGAAIRAFTDLVNDPQSHLCKYPEDFALFYLGEFDEIDGSFVGLVQPESIELAVNVKRQQPTGPGEFPFDFSTYPVKPGEYVIDRSLPAGVDPAVDGSIEARQ